MFFSPQQLADRYGVPVQTIYKWNHAGTAPRFIKVGRHVRYRLADVEAWEQANASTPAA